MQLSAMDYDAGNNGQVTYDLVHSPRDTQGDPIFNLQPGGQVRVTKANALNREEQDYYTIVVNARDGGSPALDSGMY